MKTIIGDNLEKYRIVDSLGEEQGKLKDVIVDTTKGKWSVRDLVISTGVIKKQAICFDDIDHVNDDEKTITLKDGVKPHDFDEDEFTESYVSFDELKKRDVYCENDTELGKIYDYVIAAELPQWQIHNVLINPKGDWLRGRRIRMSVDDITEVKDHIMINSNLDEIKEKCVEE